MGRLSLETYENYLKETYQGNRDEQGFFMKLVEEIGEVAELLNIRAGRKAGNAHTSEELANELADVIHYAVSIAAINSIDLEQAILEKDIRAAAKYHHKINLKDYMDKFQL